MEYFYIPDFKELWKKYELRVSEVKAINSYAIRNRLLHLCRKEPDFPKY